MQPHATLPVQPWMTAPDARATLDALAAAGIAARFVGGCVRDALAGRAVGDIDIAVDREPEAVMKALRAAAIKVVPTGIKHGTVTAVVAGKPFEITTLRRDVETFGRHARVAFTDDWRADAARRDFTINAMSCDRDGGLWDFFGGRDDLAAGRVRFVGDAATRIDEDVLRILRFFRFHAWFGRPPFDAAGLAACAAAAARLRDLSAERVRKETLRLLEAPDPAPTVAAMAGIGLFAHWIPEYAGTALLDLVVANETRAVDVDGLRRLAALLAPASDATAFGKRLRLSTQEALRLEVMLAPTPALDVRDDPAIRRQIHELARVLYLDRLMRFDAAADPARWARARDLASTWDAPELPVGGADALAAGMKAGPKVGALISALEAWWVAGDFAAGREACLAELRRRIAAGDHA
ncbi:MAG: CCA tRNA nucleotidyltransferase [Rhodospirillales bacterium]|nr:MAG: CCA tRNA nucleotidyltransferase [Rhodospirillales bacterium]